jgi:hypothetical protein
MRDFKKDGKQRPKGGEGVEFIKECPECGYEECVCGDDGWEAQPVVFEEEEGEG